ncbi:alcohol dehydrogenase catalytic domain-containing protein [Streptomyces sp. PG2]
MSRVVVFDEFGEPDVLHVLEEPVAEPAPGEVRVRIEAFAVNPLDLMVRSGVSFAPVPLPHARLGIEGTGVVDALDPGPTGLRIGEPVLLAAIPDAHLRGQLRRAHHAPREPGRRPAGRARGHGGGGDLGRVLHRLRRARRDGGHAARRPRARHRRVRRRRPGGDAARPVPSAPSPSAVTRHTAKKDELLAAGAAGSSPPTTRISSEPCAN